MVLYWLRFWLSIWVVILNSFGLRLRLIVRFTLNPFRLTFLARFKNYSFLLCLRIFVSNSRLIFNFLLRSRFVTMYFVFIMIVVIIVVMVIVMVVIVMVMMVVMIVMVVMVIMV